MRDEAGDVLTSTRAGEGAAAAADARGGAELARNRSLVARFCHGAAALLAGGGEVHLTHKVGLQQWGIEGLGGQGRGGGEAGPGLRLVGAVVFDRAAYPPYRPRKALADRGFPITDAQTFIFAKDQAGGAPTPGTVARLCPLKRRAIVV